MDFLLNQNGDIDFVKTDKEDNSLTMNFLISPSNALVLNFYCDSEEKNAYLKDESPAMVINFNLSEIKYDKDVVMTDKYSDDIYQKLKIRISSAKGTILKNESIGSYLDNYNHTILNPKNDNYISIKNVIEEAISDLNLNATIKVTAMNTIYSDYSNTLMITIKIKKQKYYFYL